MKRVTTHAQPHLRGKALAAASILAIDLEASSFMQRALSAPSGESVWIGLSRPSGRRKLSEMMKKRWAERKRKTS